MDTQGAEKDSANAATIIPPLTCAATPTTSSEAAAASEPGATANATAKIETAGIAVAASTREAATAEDATQAQSADGGASKSWAWTALSPDNRITLLAASLVLAAALGATAGALAGYRLAPSVPAPAAAPAPTNLAEIQALK